MESNLAPDPLHVHRLNLLTVQPHQTRNILLPGLVLAYAYFLLPVPLQTPLHLAIPVQARDIPRTRLDIPLPRLVLAPVPLHLAIPVQAQDIPLTRLDIPLHPPNIPQIPPDIHQ